MHGNLLSTLTKVTKDRCDPISTVTSVMSWNEDLLDVDHLMHGNWVAFFKTWRRRSLLYDRTGNPLLAVTQATRQGTTTDSLKSTHTASCSKWDDDEAWSSQEWNSDELMDDRTERPVVCPQWGAPQHFVIEDDEAESDMSLGSRSFLHRVNDQVRKRQNQSSKDATKDVDKHSVIWRMLMSSKLQGSVFLGKNYSDNQHSIKNAKISQWNRCPTCVKNWCPKNMRSMEWSICLWLVMNKSSVFSAHKSSTYFQILYSW